MHNHGRPAGSIGSRLTYTPIDDLAFNALLGVLQAGMWLLNDIESFLRTYGFSHGRFSILLAVVESETGHIRPAEIARVLGRSRPTITGMIVRLKRDGFILVRNDGSDLRGKQLSLTDKAIRLLNEIVPLYNERTRAMTAGLTGRDKHALLDTLSRLRFDDPVKTIRGAV